MLACAAIATPVIADIEHWPDPALCGADVALTEESNEPMLDATGTGDHDVNCTWHGGLTPWQNAHNQRYLARESNCNGGSRPS